MRQSKRFAPLLYYGGHIFVVRPGQGSDQTSSKQIALEQFQCDALEAATGIG
jgi:hypothetical protein